MVKLMRRIRRHLYSLARPHNLLRATKTNGVVPVRR
jgi:hypothetical protein